MRSLDFRKVDLPKFYSNKSYFHGSIFYNYVAAYISIYIVKRTFIGVKSEDIWLMMHEKDIHFMRLGLSIGGPFLSETLGGSKLISMTTWLYEVNKCWYCRLVTYKIYKFQIIWWKELIYSKPSIHLIVKNIYQHFIDAKAARLRIYLLTLLFMTFLKLEQNSSNGKIYRHQQRGKSCDCMQ